MGPISRTPTSNWLMGNLRKPNQQAAEAKGRTQLL